MSSTAKVLDFIVGREKVKAKKQKTIPRSGMVTYGMLPESTRRAMAQAQKRHEERD